MQLENVPISSLTPDPANARKHSKRNLRAIVASLQRFGQQKPIVVDSRNIVRAGNGTLAAAKSLGWTNINIVRSDLMSGELAAYSIADNRTSELAAWDTDILAGFLSDTDLGNVGFTTSEIRRLLDDVSPDGIDAVNETIEGKYQVVAECADEAQQKKLFDDLIAQGYTCRLATV